MKRIIPMLMWVCVYSLAHAQSSPSDSMATQCKKLEVTDFSRIPDAPTQVLEAKMIPAGNEMPAVCQVQGYINPNIGIELLLPIEKWNGKFIEIGCGGFCGVNSASGGGCRDALSRGYACIGSDDGHKASGLDAKWAYNNLQAKVDYGYRAVHVAGLAGKAITREFYQASAKHAYFMGCSGGGRQAILEAQRFPWDFDGIVAMDPAINLSSVFVNLLWNTLAVKDKSGQPLLSSEDIRTLHAAVLAKCDLNDGVRDGLIGDPRACNFDPGEIACSAGKTTACLSPAQVAAVRKVYAGPVTSGGERISRGGAMLGSEVAGAFGMDNYDAGLHNPALASFGAEFFRYMAFTPDPGPGWRATDFDFDRDYKRLGMMDFLYRVTDPDLRAFKELGGKLILSQGWHDSGSPMPLETVDYYETVERTMGGEKPTRDFFRLFMVPGRNHCGGGDGAWAIDHLSYLEAWVEAGRPPDVVLSVHPKDMNVRYPIESSAVQFSRPLYPYPLRAQYKGQGDPNDAGSFTARKP
jgi:hypothetical protein